MARRQAAPKANYTVNSSTGLIFIAAASTAVNFLDRPGKPRHGPQRVIIYNVHGSEDSNVVLVPEKGANETMIIPFGGQVTMDRVFKGIFASGTTGGSPQFHLFWWNETGIDWNPEA